MGLADRIKSVGVVARKKRTFHRFPSVTACLFVVIILLADAIANGGAFEMARNWVFDGYQRLDTVERSNAQTVLIDIDAESLRRIGQWPWPRDQLARLVDWTAGARVIGLDVLLTEPDRLSPGAWAVGRSDLTPAEKQRLFDLPNTDDALAAAMTRARVILAAVAGRAEAAVGVSPRPVTPVLEYGGDATQEIPPYGPLAWPLPSLARAATGIGVVSVQPEPDGIIRRMPAVTNVSGMLLPSFAAEIIRAAAGTDHIGWHTTLYGGRNAVIGDTIVPADLSGRVWLRYANRPQTHIIPAYQILDGTIPQSFFRDRIVLIGISAAGLSDVVQTPVHRAESGIMVQANLIDSMLAGDALRRPSATFAIELLVALALGIAAIILVGRLPIRAYILIFSGIAASLIIGSFVLFEISRVLIDWTLPVAALVIAMLAAFVVRIREEAFARQRYALDLSAALFQAETADRAKTEFLANASHELRTPLTAIIGFSEIMSTELLGPLPKIYADYSHDIHASATHLLAVVNGVLDLTAIDLGGRAPSADRVEVTRLFAQCQRMILSQANQRGISFATTTPECVPMLTADLSMVRQMLLNLLSNAIKHSPAGGIITLTTALDAEGWLCLSVQDNGPGIAPTDLPEIVKRFARLRSARLAQQPGIGIGLALTKSLIELHGGRIVIKSQVGAGTDAILRFPPGRLTKTEEAPECEQQQPSF